MGKSQKNESRIQNDKETESKNSKGQIDKSQDAKVKMLKLKNVKSLRDGGLLTEILGKMGAMQKLLSLGV